MTKKVFKFKYLGQIGIALTLTLALVAELFRFKGILLLDLWVPIFTFGYLGYLALKGALRLPAITLPAASFVLIGAGSLMINSTNLSSSEFAEAAFYGVRWFSTFLLSLIVIQEDKTGKIAVAWMLFIFALLLSLIGFAQLYIMPDFTSYELLGWDPHIGRLLSSWFDPNFVGGLFAFMLPLIVGTALDKKTWRKYLIPISLIVLIALGLTLSRSSYLALITGIFILGLIKSRKLLLGALMLLLLLTTLSSGIQSRVTSLVDAAQSVFMEDYTLPDQSSRLRFRSWSNGFYLFIEKPLLGYGYNQYKHAALDMKLITNLESHASSGSDSSLLTVLATTGLLGFIPFMTVYLILAFQAWKHRKNGYAAGFLAALCGLFIHCIFVNSLLFPLFMAPFWLAAGLLPHLESPYKKFLSN